MTLHVSHISKLEILLSSTKDETAAPLFKMDCILAMTILCVMVWGRAIGPGFELKYHHSLAVIYRNVQAYMSVLIVLSMQWVISKNQTIRQ